MTFDIRETEQTQSPLLNDIIPGSTEIKKEIAFKKSKATQTSFTSAAEDEEKSCAVDLEPEVLVNDNKSKQEEANKKEESVERDKDKPDEAQGGEDIEIAEHAQEELKTNGETEELESGLAHQENALEEETTENEKANAEEMLDNSGTHTEPEMSKEQLEDDQQDRDKEQEPEEQHIESLKSDQSIHLKTSAGSKELEEEETVLGSSTTFDAKLVPEEPTIEETIVLNEDVKGSPTTELNVNVVESKLDVLDILGTVETVFHDKEQTMKSKVKPRKVLDA